MSTTTLVSSSSQPRMWSPWSARGLALVAAATCTAGAGVIHLAVIRHHVHAPLVATAFAAIGAGQLWLALRTATQPTVRVCWMAAGLNAAIAAVWFVSRTVGLAFVDGAELPEPVGWPDLVANGLALAAIVLLLLPTTVRDLARTVSRKTGFLIASVLGASVLFLTASAALAPHRHSTDSDDHEPSPASEVHMHEHDH